MTRSGVSLFEIYIPCLCTDSVLRTYVEERHLGTISLVTLNAISPSRHRSSEAHICYMVFSTTTFPHARK